MRNRIPTWVALPALLTLAVSACGGQDDRPVAEAAAEPAASTAALEPVSIGVFEITSGAVFDEISDGFVEGFVDASGLSPQDVSLVEENAQGDPSLIQSIARSFAEGDTDMIAVVGTPAVIAQAEVVKDRPVIAMAMGDPVGAGVAESLDAPGGNVTGSIDYIDPALLVDELMLVHPDLTRIGSVFDPANQNMQVWIEDLRAAVAERDIDLVEAAASSSTEVEAATRSLDGRVDVVMTGPDAMVIEAIGAVGQVTRRAGIPLYGVGIDVAVDGVVASLGPDYREVGRLAGVAAAEVYLGAPAAQVPFGRPGALQWTLDTEEADELGLAIPADVLSDAA